MCEVLVQKVVLSRDQFPPRQYEFSRRLRLFLHGGVNRRVSSDKSLLNENKYHYILWQSVAAILRTPR